MIGCLFGQAVGDALGLGAEFMSKEEVHCNYYPAGLTTYDEIIRDHHRSKWEPGAWTDDTDMMLCIMESYENGKFNLHKVAQNFKDWANSNPADIGINTYRVLSFPKYVEQPEVFSELVWNLSEQQSAANGALMRTCVVGLAQDHVEEQATDICKLTHYDPRCIGSCVIVSLIIHNLIYNDYELPYDEIRSLAKEFDERIIEWIDLAHQNKDISALELDKPHSRGYTLRTLAGALWCYWHASSFGEGLFKIVNEGGDADTNAAVACAILGAKFGYSSIPTYYTENLHDRETYHSKIIKFLNQVQKP